MHTPVFLAALTLSLFLVTPAKAEDKRLVLLGVSYGKNVVAICDGWVGPMET